MKKKFSPAYLSSDPDFEHLYRLQVDELADYALFLIDPEGVIASWNKGVEAIMAYHREDFVGKPLAEIYTPEDRAAGVPEAEMRTAAECGRSSDVRWHLRKDGTRLFVDGVLNSVRDENGGIVGYSKVLRDATSKHDAELALQESESFARSIVDSSPDCVEVLDLEGRVQSINETGCQSMEIGDPEQYKGKPWLNFWDGESRAAAQRAIQAGRDGRQTRFEGYSPTRKGTSRWWEVIVTPILDAQERPSRLLSICRDITERRQTEKLMQRSRDDLAEFAHVASHDLQAPLRTMRSYAQLLSKRYKGKLDEDADTFLSFILEGAQNMEELIRGLLQYAEYGEKEEWQKLALADVVDTVLTTLTALIDETGAKITCGQLPEVEANPIQIQQVFQNLISNALKYRSSAEPLIHIESKREEDHWVISVADNGVGIASEYYDRVFQPLKRLHGSEIAGTGLGLAVCKRIVERNGGRIWVDSTPGKGSTFCFTIPI